MILLAILSGILTTLAIRCTTKASALRATVRKIQADLLEFRLYFDEPRLIWQAQVNLVRDNLRLFLLFLPATLILALPMLWLILQLDQVYGLRPLHPGEAAVFTAQLTRPLAATDHVALQSAAGIRIETPPVWSAWDNQVTWRIRPIKDGRSALDLNINGRLIRKSIISGDSPMILSPRRSSTLTDFLLHPEEPRLPEGDIAWLEVDYPKRESRIPWLVWFVIISTAAAFLSARYSRVLSQT
jgi:hypothetical protein